MIEELDRVALARPLPDHGLVVGDIGAVVAVHQNGKGYIVEFMSLVGKAIAVVTLDAAMIRSLRASEVAHVREVA